MQTSPAFRFALDRRPWHKSALAGLLLLSTIFTMPSWAAMVTTNEIGMEAIFSQTGFPEPIDLRFQSIIDYEAPALLDLDSSAEWNILTSATFLLPTTTVRMFFIDDVS